MLEYLRIGGFWEPTWGHMGQKEANLTAKYQRELYYFSFGYDQIYK